LLILDRVQGRCQMFVCQGKRLAGIFHICIQHLTSSNSFPHINTPINITRLPNYLSRRPKSHSNLLSLQEMGPRSCLPLECVILLLMPVLYAVLIYFDIYGRWTNVFNSCMLHIFCVCILVGLPHTYKTKKLRNY